PAQRPDPQWRITHEGRDVQADGPVVATQVAVDRGPVVVDIGPAVEPAVEVDEAFELLARLEWREAVAVDADHLGRHALAHLRLMPRVGQDHETAVTVEVDEPGRRDLAVRVDPLPKVFRWR